LISTRDNQSFSIIFYLFMKKRRINWPQGNNAFTAWEIETPAGEVVVRRNHPIVRRGERLCQGWDVWLDGQFVGTLGSRPFAELAAFSRSELLRAVRPACCGRHRSFLSAEGGSVPSNKGGPRPNAGRKPLGEDRRVGLNTTVQGRTLELIDERRGARSRGQYLDDLLHGREPQSEAAS
jgi:hypothetical protein